ncbi:MAG: DUF2007 domain-containing protein [Chloroflexota bacterium]
MATAPYQLQAEIWREFLQQNGIPATINASDTTSFLGLSPFPCRLLTPAEHADAARALLEELAQAVPIEEDEADPPDHP